MSLLSVVGIAVVIPFIMIAADPQSIFQNKKLLYVYNLFHFSSSVHFIFFIGVLAFLMLVLTNSMAAFTLWLSNRVAANIRAKITRTLYTIYLYKPYEFHIENNSASLANNLITLTEQFTQGYLFQLLQLITNAVLVLFITALVILANPEVALLTFLLFGGGYCLVYMCLKGMLQSKSEIMVTSGDAIYKLINESLGGIKDIKLKNNEAEFVKQSSPLLLQQAECRSVTQLMQSMPRYFIEAVAFGGIILITLVLMGHHSRHVIPVLGLYAYSGYRLLPALQAMFAGISQIKVSAASLDKVYDSVSDEENIQWGTNERSVVNCKKNMSFGRQFSVSALSYHYPGHHKSVLENVSLMINQNEMVGIIGETGAGKTTLIDIMLGLLRPTQGQLIVDDFVLDTNDKIQAWQKNLGYVPQFIFLADCSIRENIAFGLPADQINQVIVEQVARTAAIHDFVVNELPDGYDTLVGERGVKLSGGQIQRIGIARALYSQPSLLILDEATSSLDGKTESAVMEAVKRMRHQITIVIIAHRLSTVADCDRVYLMKQGRVIDQGCFADINQRHQLTAEAA
ncbi:MAG: ABC transporter ATP-binding protein/permease [Gammaproteobacteria bacterium]|nr:ABC transporter ATP-binding protein/permease [Gammaproteobacteria bacterium]MCH9744480.1 ABC transporter ATP-binding protein/permease [Gammaproteobacteria bacterium]